MERFVRGIWIATLVGLAGCDAGFPFLPANLSLDEPIERTWLRSEGRASFYQEEGIDDGEWLEIQWAGGEDPLRGYLSTDSHNGAIIVMLNGASTFLGDGEVGGAREWHQIDAPFYRDRGYRTLTPAMAECGVPYGQQEVDEVVQFLDWLEEEGKALLGVQDVYVYGYSSGAITAAMVNTRRAVNAYVGIGGLYEPDQLTDALWFYYLISGVSPNNEGLCQLRTTLDFYGSADSPAWEHLDIVSQIEAFHSPMLFGHGLDDFVLNDNSAQHLQNRYDALVADGVEMPELEFMFFRGSHHVPKVDPEARQRTLDFLERHATR